MLKLSLIQIFNFAVVIYFCSCNHSNLSTDFKWWIYLPNHQVFCSWRKSIHMEIIFII